VLLVGSSYDMATSSYKVHKFHGKEQVHVESVKLCGAPQTSARALHTPRVCLTYRVPVSVL